MSRPSRGKLVYVLLVALGVALAALAGSALRSRERADAARARAGVSLAPSASEREARAPDAAEPLAWPAHIDAIVVGGGPSPDANQVSLEADVAVATEALGPNAITLFAGGPGTRSVQVADIERRGDPLLARIGDLFAPRGGRDAHYRATTLRLHGPATLARFEEALERAIAMPGGPLTIYVAGHGEGGEAPSESRALFWGGDALDVPTLASYLDAHPPARTVRFVVTTCFSGGFAELAFVGAERTSGVSEQPRCGLFATSWDEEASGCDPDPERARHDGFGVYFLSALSGRDRDGADARARLDLDGDGVIGPYEALTYARVESRSIDVPTTTSEAYLRAVASELPASTRPLDRPPLPEQRAVLDALLAATGISGEAELERRLAELRRRKEENDAAMEEEGASVDALYLEFSSELLSRWPVLDDPYHPDFASTLEADREEVERALTSSRSLQRYLDADDDLAAMASADLTIRLELALLRRIEDAYETIRLARALEAARGAAWERYLALRACEWGSP